MTDAGYSRLLKFCCIGALGIGVQFGALMVLQRWRIHYLVATGLAVECAVIHNFLWHRRFTWVDRLRPGAGHFLCSLFRFHASNGMISLFGNLVIMQVLSGELQVPVLEANIVAIAICFLANFVASDFWVFRVF